MGVLSLLRVSREGGMLPGWMYGSRDALAGRFAGSLLNFARYIGRAEI